MQLFFLTSYLLCIKLTLLLLLLSPLISSYHLLSHFISSYFFFYSKLDLDFINYCDIRKASNRLVDQQEQTLQYLQFYYFGEEIIQPISIQLSDWYADNLEYEQLRYATYDALMCRQIYDEIDKRGMLQLIVIINLL